jgi:CBS domain-containing protein
VTVRDDTPVSEVAEILDSRRIKRVPVVRDGHLVGIVARADLIRVLTASAAGPSTAEADDTALQDAVLAELRRQDWLSVTPSAVEVDHGVVRIWGRALSQEELEAVSVAAENVPGVRKVLNYMEVAPGASFQPI